MTGRTDQQLLDAWATQGAAAPQTADEALRLGRRLMSAPCMAEKPSDPTRRMVAADIKTLYEAAVPDEHEPALTLVNGKFFDLNAPGGGQ